MATKRKRREINYYKVLGVSPRAGQEKIKKAYRRRARETHPDLKGGDHQKFKVVQKAYETLSDPQSRNLYDLRNGFRPNPTKRPRRPRPKKQKSRKKDSAWPDVQNVFEKFAQFLEKEWWDEEDYERRGRG